MRIVPFQRRVESDVGERSLFMYKFSAFWERLKETRTWLDFPVLDTVVGVGAALDVHEDHQSVYRMLEACADAEVLNYCSALAAFEDDMYFYLDNYAIEMIEASESVETRARKLRHNLTYIHNILASMTRVVLLATTPALPRGSAAAAAGSKALLDFRQLSTAVKGLEQVTLRTFYLPVFTGGNSIPVVLRFEPPYDLACLDMVTEWSARLAHFNARTFNADERQRLLGRLARVRAAAYFDFAVDDAALADLFVPLHRRFAANDDDDSRKCAICLNDARTHLVAPCGHKAFCTRCVEKLTECAICKSPIEGRIRVFG